MSFCSNCGAELTEGTAFCPSCGAGQVRSFDAPEQPVTTPESEVVPAEPVYQEPVNQQPVPVYQQPVYQPQVETAATLPTAAKIMGIISMVCGIMSLVTCYVGFMFSIPALILAKIANNKSNGLPNSKARVGKITGIIGIPLSVICFIVYVVVVAGTFAGMESSYYYYSYY